MWSEPALQNQRLTALKDAKVNKKLLNLQPNIINERRVNLSATISVAQQNERK